MLNFAIKRNAEDLVNRLEPIAQSLDAVQKDKCSIAEAVHIWKKLQVKFNELNLDKSIMKFFTQRYNQALGPPHFLAYLIDPCYCESDSTEKKKKAFDFTKKKKFQ